MDLSLRELWWAMRARQKAEWERTARLMSWFAAKLVGESIDSDTLNPFATKPKRDPAAEKAEAWGNLKDGFKAFVRGSKSGSRKLK